MLWIDPNEVAFGSLALAAVSAISVDRRAERAVVDWGDIGPHAVFADVPEQRVTIRIARAVQPGDALAPKPGESGVLRFRAGAAMGESGSIVVSATAVVLGVSHAADQKRGMVQTIDLVAISSDGVVDPITESPVV